MNFIMRMKKIHAFAKVGAQSIVVFSFGSRSCRLQNKKSFFYIVKSKIKLKSAWELLNLKIKDISPYEKLLFISELKY